jgi:hypothetical protein
MSKDPWDEVSRLKRRAHDRIMARLREIDPEFPG